MSRQYIVKPAGPIMAEPDPQWPEDVPPSHIGQTEFSMLEHHGSRIVWGEGNPQAPIMIVLDNPGAKEDGDGKPFVCGTRLTLRQALSQANIAPADCYATFLLKRRPTRAYDRPAAYDAYRPVLEKQITHMNPRVLVFCGGTVVNALLDPEAEIKHTRGRQFLYLDIPVVATYHPLACRRRPQLLPYLVADLQLARTFATG